MENKFTQSYDKEKAKSIESLVIETCGKKKTRMSQALKDLSPLLCTILRHIR